MWRGTVILGLLSALVGCAAPAPNLGIIYKQEAAQTKKVPIVMIPGFPGSVLEEKNLRTGETRRLWGSVIAILDRTRFDDLEMRIDAKAIEDMGDPRANPERDPENRTVKAVDVIGEFTFFTRSVGVYDAYEGMLDMLIKDAGYHLASTEDFRNKADGREPADSAKESVHAR